MNGKPFLFVLLAALLLLPLAAFSGRDTTYLLTSGDATLEYDPIIVKNIPTHFQVVITDSLLRSHLEGQYMEVFIDGRKHIYPVVDGCITFKQTFDKSTDFEVRVHHASFERGVNPVPLWMSILPPLIAILMALLFKEVFTSLFTGLLVGASIIQYYTSGNILLSIFRGGLSIVDTYAIDALSHRGHLSIIIFSLLIGGTIHIITRNGGMQGVVNRLSAYARSARSGQMATWFLGFLIFFDDYANTLVVGNTMRPVTDRLKVSREKLAYIVDSTAAPIASIAFVSTWIGAELSYIADGIETIGLDATPYGVFFNSLAYAFYPVFALALILFLVRQKLDYGPMLTTERKARAGDSSVPSKGARLSANDNQTLKPEKNINHHSYNAIIPIAVIILGAFSGLLYTGVQEAGWHESHSFTHNLSSAIGHADTYKALLWASLGGLLSAMALTLSQRLLPLDQMMNSMVNGFRSMLTAIIILILAWCIAGVTRQLHTAHFISQILQTLEMTPYPVPAITFVMAALVAFSTGSSWGTMAILYPLILPATWMICQESGLDHDASMSIFYNVVSTVLAGAVLGDHCSPISDTTILSSLASSCDHIAHVRTQLPYALTAGGVAIFAGTLPAAYGVPFYILFPAGLGILYLLVRLLGQPTEQ